MKTFLRFILFLTLVVWLGGIIFFSAVTAPATFSVMSILKGGRHIAGEIVGKSLFALHSMAQICAAIFLIASIALYRSASRAAQLLVAVMLGLTLFSQYWVTPRITPLRYQLWQKEDAEARKHFAQLHSTSVALEGTVLLLGLGVVWLIAKERE